jgi:hypothetical protein
MFFQLSFVRLKYFILVILNILHHFFSFQSFAWYQVLWHYQSYAHFGQELLKGRQGMNASGVRRLLTDILSDIYCICLGFGSSCCIFLPFLQKDYWTKGKSKRIIDKGSHFNGQVDTPQAVVGKVFYNPIRCYFKYLDCSNSITRWMESKELIKLLRFFS